MTTATVAANFVPPALVFIVDASANMGTVMDPDGTTKWQALQNALLGSSGIITSMTTTTPFGLALFHSEGTGVCPLIDWVPPAQDSFLAIDTTFQIATPTGGRPTGQAISQTLLMLTSGSTGAHDRVLFVLVIGAPPEHCTDPLRAEPEAIQSVAEAKYQDIRTAVVAVGPEVPDAHLQSLANAGSDPPASYFRATDVAGVGNALRGIVSRESACVRSLDRAIVDSEVTCTGSVSMGGNTLACGDPNGWRFVDERHIEILGTACVTLEASPSMDVTAMLPCSALAP